MYYRSIGSGLGIGRYSKSNDSDSDSRAKKPDRDIPSQDFNITALFTMYHSYRLSSTVFNSDNNKKCFLSSKSEY